MTIVASALNFEVVLIEISVENQTSGYVLILQQFEMVQYAGL
jgi:hypothetical protein